MSRRLAWPCILTFFTFFFLKEFAFFAFWIGGLPTLLAFLACMACLAGLACCLPCFALLSLTDSSDPLPSYLPTYLGACACVAPCPFRPLRPPRSLRSLRPPRPHRPSRPIRPWPLVPLISPSPFLQGLLTCLESSPPIPRSSPSPRLETPSFRRSFHLPTFWLVACGLWLGSGREGRQEAGCRKEE